MGHDFSRTDRVAELIQKELASMIYREMKDPRVQLVTICYVKISKDLKYAKVFVSVMDETRAEETIDALKKAAGFFRGLLAKRMQMRSVPRLDFVYDDTVVRASRLSQLIKQSPLSKDGLDVSQENIEGNGKE